MIKTKGIISLCVIIALFIGSFGGVPAHAATMKALQITVDHGLSLSLATPASSVFIANPDVADVQVMSPTSIMIFGKRTGETTFVATDSSGRPLIERTVQIVQDLSSLAHELNIAIPGNKIKAESLPNGILLTGEARDPASVADAYKMAQRFLPAQGGDIINRVHVAGSNQIMIRVRFAEVQRNINNTLGIDWNSAFTLGGMAFGVVSGAAIFDSTGAFQRPVNSTLALPNDGLLIQKHSGSTNINDLIDALAQDGLVTILAEPTLTAMSGETANFLAGGEFPIVIPQGGAGAATYTVEFKSYGISLAFTPTLINENRISLHVKPEVSELTTVGAVTLNNISIPALTTRRAETTVEVGSGQSFAIAGLLDNSQSETVNKYPVIGDLPVIGALFRSSNFISGQTELVVIITPYVVRPTSQELALPTDGYSAPSEIDRLANLRYSSSDPATHTTSGTRPTAVEVPVHPTTAMPIEVAPTPMYAPAPTLVVPPNAPITPAPQPVSQAPIYEAPTPSAAPVSPVTPVAETPTIVNPPSANAGPTNLAPTGPGGFELE